MNNKLQKKIDFGIKLIQAAAKKANEYDQPLEVAYSGGKDSDVILELTKMAGVEYRAIYKNTTIDPPGTIKHVVDMGVEIRQPKQNFRELIQNNGMPSRYYRFCCSRLKEYKIFDYVIIGIRAEESRKRKERYTEPETCRAFSKDEEARQYLPILNWSLDDVTEFIKDRNLQLAPVYYDEKGCLHTERRLGCMCCPLASRKKRIAQFKQYPKMVKLYCDNERIYLSTHPNTKTIKKFNNDPYAILVENLFFKTYDEFKLTQDGLFGRFDNKKFLEEYFNVKL